MISAVNYSGYCGFRLNSEDYSAYPHECEFLLMDGIRFIVLKVEEFSIERITLLNRDTRSSGTPEIRPSSDQFYSSSLSSGIGNGLGGFNASLVTAASH